MSEIFSKILKDKNGKVLNVGSKYTQPEWGTETAIVDILPEATHTAFQVQEGMAVYSLPAAQHPLADGKAYEVNYNGTAYNCICREQKDGTDGGLFALGNVGLLEIEGWEMTDNPFIIIFNYGATIEEQGAAAQMVSLDGSGTVTLSIKGEGEIIHPIPSEFTGVLYVNLDNEKYTADKTPDEIKTALNAGRIVIARGEMKVGSETAGYNYSTWYYSFTGINMDGLPVFSNVFLQLDIQINEDGTCTTVNLG